MASRTLGQLWVEYRATADKFTADLSKMAKEAKEFEKTIKPLKDQAQNIGKAMSAVGGAVSGAFVLMAKQAANYGDQIRDASIRTGISTQALSGLKYAAEQTGTSFEGVSGSLQRMSRNVLAAASGSKEAQRTFQAFGVAIKDASGQLRPMDAILGDVADRFSKMKDGTEKAAAAQLLFGRNGAVMIEFLNQGRSGIEEFRMEAARMGLELDENATRAADEFNDSLNKLKNAQLGLSVAIGNALIPSLTKAITAVTEVAIRFQQFANENPNLTRGIFAVAAAIAGSGGLLLGLTAVLTILPKLHAAFLLLHSVMAPASILLAVRNFGDLSAAVTLLGQASLAAKLGMIGLAAGIGVAVGHLINMGIQMAGLQPLLDKTLLSMSRSLGLNRQIGQTLGNSAADIKKATDALAERGVVVERGTMSEQQYVEALAKAARAHFGLKDKVVESGKATSDYDKLMQDMLKSLEKTPKALDNTKDKLAELANFLRGAEQNLVAPISRFANVLMDDSGIDQAFRKIKESAEKAFLAIRVGLGSVKLDPLLSDMEMLDLALESNIKFTKEQAAREAELAAARKRDLENYQRDLQRATDDIKRSAGKIFDDMFIKGENVFKSLKNLLKGGALSLGRAIFEDIAGMLLGPIKKAFDDFFKGLLDKTVGNFARTLGEKLGEAIGGAAVNAGTSAIPGVGGSVGSSVGSAVGSAAGSAASSFLTSTLSSSIGAAVGAGITELFQRGRQQRTEENTRETRDILELVAKAWNPLFHEIRFFTERISENTMGLQHISDGIIFLQTWLIPNINASGARTVNAIRELGGRSQLPLPVADISGAVTPRLAGDASGATVNNFTFNTTVESGATMTGQEFRDKVVPEIIKLIQNGTRGLRGEISTAVRNDMPGLVTA